MPGGYVMRKFVCQLSLLPLILLCFVPSALFGQQHKWKPPRKPPPPPAFPTYTKFKKKDTVVSMNPYKQDTLLHTIPMGRVLFHDKIDKEQMAIDAADGKADTVVTFIRRPAFTDSLSNAFLDEVDALQVRIENMPANGRDEVADNQNKIRYLRAVYEMLQPYRQEATPDPVFYIRLVENMDSMLMADNEGKLMEFAQAHTSVYTLDNGKELWVNNPDVRAYIYVQIGRMDPLMMLNRLSEYAKDSFAGEIIKAAAQLKPDLVYNYTTSTNIDFKKAVYNAKDPLVQAIVSIAAESKAPLKAFPFLSDIYTGKKTVAGVDSMGDRPNVYFQNLVRLKMNNETLTQRIYTDEMVYRTLKYYVRPMNDLHESKDEVRFKCLDSLSSTSLYYILVYGQDEIYTSSFLGTFKRLLERMPPLRGDQFLDTLHFDHFRTFIRMSAGYSTLSDFLATIDDTARTKLMTRFIDGLGKGREDDLEDAVDVANAFGSISDSTLMAFLKERVKDNYRKAYDEENKKGKAIYSLLARIFIDNAVTASDTIAAVTSSKLHLPPINKVLYKDLVNDSGIVYQQVLFFGDKDGQDSYDSYLSEFKKDKNWLITPDQYWTTISSVTGKKIVIYANLPLKEPDDEDAQRKLAKFLDDSGIKPTIIIHRGHSYHVPMTLTRLTPQVKIVILGSCGGYHNLSLALDRSPDAHIVSSKQTGVRAVNEPIIKSLNTLLLNGADINWITMWNQLTEYFSKKPGDLEKFSDYVPPYKNLGAIFIKAYKKMMAS